MNGDPSVWNKDEYDLHSSSKKEVGGHCWKQVWVTNFGDEENDNVLFYGSYIHNGSRLSARVSGGKKWE